MAPARRKRSGHMLSHGRPLSLAVKKKPVIVSSQKGRQLIRKHHELSKNHAQALAEGNQEKAESIRNLIDAQGGLEAYQAASIAGQSSTRGGDSSKQLISWLAPDAETRKSILSSLQHERKGRKWRLLEVGALSTQNECSTCGLFDVTRIDLNSQMKGIERQDFMERPLPSSDSERFDLISLSLVLNYVPEAKGRGQMLMRTRDFLQSSSLGAEDAFEPFKVPSLFLVLPAPCVTNSRYVDEQLVDEIMESLGYVLIFKKLSSKLVYYLWHYQKPSSPPKRCKSFRKIERRSGGSRNNFAIVLE